MKKVWILEKFASREDMDKTKEFHKEMLEHFKNEGNDKSVLDMERVIACYENTMKENPDGYWYGFEGKIKYNEFCYTAKDAIRRNPDGKFRVIEGEIKDDAQYWTGYKFVKENEGVLRYLMATK